MAWIATVVGPAENTSTTSARKHDLNAIIAERKRRPKNKGANESPSTQ